MGLSRAGGQLPAYRSHCGRDLVSVTAVTSISCENCQAPTSPPHGPRRFQGTKSSWSVRRSITVQGIA